MIRLSDFDRHCLTWQFGEAPVMCKIVKMKGGFTDRIDNLRSLAIRNRLYVQVDDSVLARQVRFEFGIGFYYQVTRNKTVIRSSDVIKFGYVWTNGIY